VDREFRALGDTDTKKAHVRTAFLARHHAEAEFSSAANGPDLWSSGLLTEIQPLLLEEIECSRVNVGHGGSGRT
jgi:hypothetical protein